MRPDEADIDRFDAEQDDTDQSVIIAFDIEDKPLVSDVIGRGKRMFQLVETVPFRFRGFFVPLFQGRFCVGVPGVESDQCFLGNDSHNYDRCKDTDII